MYAYLEETSHGFVGAADLQLVEGSLVAVATGTSALDGDLVGVIPGAGPAEDILTLLLLERAPRE